MANETQKEKFVVIYDTYCGWCYGAAPVFDALIDTNADVEVLHRHLFQGTNTPRMSEGKGHQILRMIPLVETLTRREFSDAFKTKIAESDTEVLRSGLSAQAAALVHDQGPKKEFAVRKRLENLHFKDGVSSTDRDAIVDALIAEGLAAEEAEKIGTPELESLAETLSNRAASLMAAVGSHGVPTILKVDGDTFKRVNHEAFYGRADMLSDSPHLLQAI